MNEEYLNDKVSQWHNMSEEDFIKIGSPRLHHYLGLTWQEYMNWTVNGRLTANSDESRMEP